MRVDFEPVYERMRAREEARRRAARTYKPNPFYRELLEARCQAMGAEWHTVTGLGGMWGISIYGVHSYVRTHPEAFETMRTTQHGSILMVRAK